MFRKTADLANRRLRFYETLHGTYQAAPTQLGNRPKADTYPELK